MNEFRSGFTRLMYVVGGVGVVGTLGAWLLGPFAVELLYDAELSRRTLAVLALGSACYMFGLAIAQAVIALHGHAQVAIGWTAGMVTFVRVDVADRRRGVPPGRARLCSSVRPPRCSCFAWALRSRLRSGAVPERVVDARGDDRHALRDLSPEVPRLSRRASGRRAVSAVRAWRSPARGRGRPSSDTSVGKSTSGSQPSLVRALRRVADQQIDLGRAEELRVLAHVALPVVDADLGEGTLDQLLDRCGSRRWRSRSRRARPAAASSTSP